MCYIDNVMKKFDLLNTSLSGINLIEAGAGTGKTYAIEGLFLRLVIEERIPVEKILVVTFTKAATQELKERIRNKLLAAKTAFSSGNSLPSSRYMTKSWSGG